MNSHDKKILYTLYQTRYDKQTYFHTNQRNEIVQLKLHSTILTHYDTRRFRKQVKYKDKQCRWCNKTFKPHHSAQLYCCNTCSDYATQEHTLRRVRRFRKRYRDVLKLVSKPVLGTGGLGGHACTGDWMEEYNKIRKELRDTGLHVRNGVPSIF